jgi:hypothetical protein
LILDFSENPLKTNVIEPIITVKILGSIVVRLKNLGLSLLFCVEVGYYGCSVKLSVLYSAAAEIKTVAKNYLISPCSSKCEKYN